MTNAEKVRNVFLENFGLSEVPSKTESNPFLIRMFKWALPWWSGDDSQLSWCAIFLGYAFKEAGLSEMIPKHFYRARSWQNVGIEKPLNQAVKGDILVFWRKSPSSGLGHVGLCEAELNQFCKVLGANQNNKVGFKDYPMYRRIAVRSIPDVFVSKNTDRSIIDKLLLKFI